MSGRLQVATKDQVRSVLHLRRELNGLSGTEYGWRYVRWVPPGNSLLLQFFDQPETGSEIALLYDRRPPTPEFIDGCRIQAEVAAAQAGLTIDRISPEVTSTALGPDWDEAAPRAARANTLGELLSCALR